MRKRCVFPMWDDVERPTHLYCEEPTREGSAYCDGHHSICWRPRVTTRSAAPGPALQRLALLP